MKLTTIFLIVSLFQVQANSYGQNTKLTLDFNDASVSQIFNQIETISEFRFLYESGQIDLQRKTSLKINKGKISNILDVLFENTNIDYKINGRQVILTPKKVQKIILEKSIQEKEVDDLAGVLQHTVSGTVVDDQGAPLPGASIVEKGTTNGTQTDFDGNFSLTMVDGNAILVVSYIGYANREIAVNEQTQLNIILSESAAGLDEVVVVGYGTMKKTDLTGSISSVSSKNVTQVKAISNVAQVLQGQAAGVQVIQRSGQPGEYVSIKIRGTNSIAGGNDPLYVVDGLPLDGLSAQLNPADIDQIQVLKDASATAIYGSRGANGVILITTKRGNTGKPSIVYNGYYGYQQLRKKMDVLNASEFAQLQNEVAMNDGKDLPWTPQQIVELGEGYDWQDLVYRTAHVQTHDISISGGSENSKYYSSFGYFNQDGIIQNSGFERLSFRTNFDQKINDRLSLNVSLSLQNSNYLQGVFAADGGGSIPFTAMVMPPTTGIYDANGEYTRFTGVSWGETNPIGISSNLKNPINTTRIIGNFGASYEILEGLSLKLSAGIDANYSKTDYYAPSNISIGQNANAQGGRAYKNYSNGSTFVNENLLAYNKLIGNHQFDIVTGLTYQKSKYENLNSGTALGFISDIYENNNLGSASTKAQPSTGYSDNSLLSYLSRINYNFDSKYFLTLTGRYDGSSRFGQDNRFAFFPSGSVAWRVSQEDFFKDINVVSDLKIRASYGSSGNQAIASYQTLARLNNVNVVFDNLDNTGFVQGSLDNTGLKWETTSQLDLGLDLSLIGGKIQLTADYYDKRTKDLLLNVTLPPSVGFGSVLQNVGIVQNKGFEFQLITNNTLGSVNWNTNLTVTRNRTKILDLGNDANGDPILYKEVGTGGNWFPMIVGNSLSQLYGHTVLGVYQTDDEAIANGEANKRAGDYKFRNTNGDDVVNDDDKSILTSLEPKFTFGLNNHFTYKNLDLSFLIVGSVGNDIVNEFRKYNLSLNGNWTPTREAFEGRWQGPGTSNTFGRPSGSSGDDIRDYANSLWVENGEYLRVRDITLGYTLPASWTSKIKIASARVYASGQNLITVTKYSGYDPEAAWSAASINGWDRGVFPSSKSITFGVNLGF